MSKNHLTVEGLRIAFELQGVEKLSLSRNAITTAMLTDARVLTAIRNCKVKHLNLRDNSIESSGFEEFLQAVKKNASIVSMNLDSNDLGDEGANLLYEYLKDEKELESVRISHSITFSLN